MSDLIIKFPDNEIKLKYSGNEFADKEILKILVDNLNKLVSDNGLNYSDITNKTAILSVLKGRKKEQELSKYEKALENILNFETDTITMDIIEHVYGFEGVAENIIAYMLDLAYKNAPATSKTDPNNVRLRFSELLTQVFFKELSASLDRYMKDIKANNKDSSLSKYFNRDTILNKMFETTAGGYRLPELLQILETSSPLEEISNDFTVKFGGPDGLKKEQRMMDIAILHKDAMGIIAAYDTPENNNTSRTNRLTIGALIENYYGKLSKDKLNRYSILSPVEALVPFIEHNDGNRVLLASNQLRSVVPLHKTEPPIVQTGAEDILSHLSSLFIKRAKDDGKVIEKTNDYMVVEYKDGSRDVLNTNYQILRTGKGTYLIHLTPTGKKVFKKGDILVQSDFFKNDKIEFGVNVLCAFLHYPGLTYEDGIVVSESFAKKIGLIKKVYTLTIPIYAGDKIAYIYDYKKNPFVRNGSIILRVEMAGNTKEVEEEFEYGDDTDTEEAHTEIDGKYKNIRAKAGKIIDIQIYANTDKIDDDILKQHIEVTKQRTEKYEEYIKSIGTTDEPIFLVKDQTGLYSYRDRKAKYIIKITIESLQDAKYGDKLANRHGNKGVISKILPDNLMPKTEEGETIHVILDPLGVVNRMNIGQLYEAAIAYLSKKVFDKHVKDYATFKKVYKQFMEILFMNAPDVQKAYIYDLTETDYTQLYNEAARINALPIIVPPFSHITKGRVNVIKMLEDKFKIKTTQKLYLPEFNKETDYPVQIGYMYMMRLEHITEETLHMRFIGRRKGLTYQAVKGKKKGGGYRVGEFDSWQLLANDVPNVIKELFFVNAESEEFETDVLRDIIQTGQTKLPEKIKLRSDKLIDIIKASLMIK